MMEIHFIKMKGHTLFQGKIITKLKIHYPRFKILPLRIIRPISTKLGGLTSKDHLIIKKEMVFSSQIQLYDINIALSKFVYWF